MNTIPPSAPVDHAPGTAPHAELPPHAVPEPVPASAASIHASRKTNLLAILSLIIAFPVGLAGIVLGAVSLGQIRRTGEAGRGLAVGGIVVGTVNTLIVILAGTLVVVALAAGEAAVRDHESDPAAWSLTDDAAGDADDPGDTARPDADAIDDYLAAVVPDITTVFQEIDPLLDDEEVTSIWTESMLVDFGTELLADTSASTKAVFVEEVVASSDGLLSQDQASRLYQAVLDAARAHLR